MRPGSSGPKHLGSDGECPAPHGRKPRRRAAGPSYAFRLRGAKIIPALGAPEANEGPELRDAAPASLPIVLHLIAELSMRPSITNEPLCHGKGAISVHPKVFILPMNIVPDAWTSQLIATDRAFFPDRPRAIFLSLTNINIKCHFFRSSKIIRMNSGLDGFGSIFPRSVSSHASSSGWRRTIIGVPRPVGAGPRFPFRDTTVFS